MIYIPIIIKALFACLASLGFAVLFNVPRRILVSIMIIAFLAGVLKFTALEFNLGLVWASFFAAILVGTLSVPFARAKHAPPLTIAIPSIISMVPGAYIYRTILGMINIANVGTDKIIDTQLVIETIHNGIYSLFIIIAISIGASIPTIITRRQIMTDIESIE